MLPLSLQLHVILLQQLDYAPLPSGSDPLLLRWFGEQVSLWKGRKAEEVDMAKVIDPKRLLATRMAARMRHLHSEMSVRLPEPLSPHASASTPPSPTLPPALRDGQGADGDGSAAAAAEGDEASGVLTAARAPPPVAHDLTTREGRSAAIAEVENVMSQRAMSQSHISRL